MKAGALAALAAASLCGCLFSGGAGGTTPKRPAWDIRFVMERAQQGTDPKDDYGDSVEMFLDGKGRIGWECRMWKHGRCWWGTLYDFDAHGNWVYTRTIDDGDTIGNETPLVHDYDSAGRIAFSREMWPGRKQPYRITEFLYDGGGRLTEMNRYMDFVGGSPSGTWRLRYDAEGRLDSLHFNDGLFTTVSLRYAYDGSGRLERVTERDRYYSRYERDSLGRIARIFHGGWGPDGAESVYPLAYRDTTVRYEPDPFRLLFMPQWYR